jgi:putative salt-induced outer membrane protein YdiY
MKVFLVLALLLLCIAAAPIVGADSVTLKNGDHLTGTVTASDGKQLTLKTDYAGEIKLQWSAVKELTTEKALYVMTPDKKMVNGTITTTETEIVVHTASAGDVRVPLAQISVVRSMEDQAAYEKSLHPSVFEAWKGDVNIGLALARGNSETTNLNTAFLADRKTLSDHVALYLSSLYATNDLPGGGVTANSILAGARFDRNFTKQLFVFVSGDFTHDQLQDLNVRAIYSGGLGLHAINNPNTTFDVLAGGNYTRETYSSAGETPGVTRNLAGVTLGEDFIHKLGKSTVFTEHFYFYPDLSNTGEYRMALDVGAVTKINKWLGWQLTVSDRYVSDPPIPGTKANDVVFSTGLNVAFSH